MRKTSITLTLSLALLMLSTSGFGQNRVLLNAEKQAIVSAKLNALTQNINSVTSSFVQEKVFSFLEDKLLAQGKFWFVAPDKIRWEYEKPYPYVIIMSEGKMYINDNGESYSMDMRSNQLFQQMNALITKSIQGKLLSEEVDYLQQFFEDKQHYIVSFTPKNPQLKEYLASIEIYFSKENAQVEALKMIENAGDYTFIKFSNRVENSNLNPNLFKFQ